MMNDAKKLSVVVSRECWKSLSILAIKHDTTMQAMVSEMLEKSVSKKSKEIEEA